MRLTARQPLLFLILLISALLFSPAQAATPQTLNFTINWGCNLLPKTTQLQLAFFKGNDFISSGFISLKDASHQEPVPPGADTISFWMPIDWYSINQYIANSGNPVPPFLIPGDGNITVRCVNPDAS